MSVKILYHHRTRSKDGQTVHVDGLVGAMRRLGHEVIVVGPLATRAGEFGADGDMVSLLKKVMPRAVYEALELAYSAAAFRRLRRAYLAHRPDALYERYNLSLLAGVWLNRLYGIPMLLEVNAPLVEERLKFGGLALRRLMDATERTIWRSADAVLPVTQALGERVRARGVDANRIVVVPNGVGPEFLASDLDGTSVRRRYGIDGRTVLGFAGFVREWHGLDAAIDVIASSGPSLSLHLLIAGDGPARERLERQARRLGVSSRVTFAGIVPRAEIASFVAAFDIALQPHVVPYASPLKIFEYMAAGRAIIAPDVSNIQEILESNETALLVDPDNPDALRCAVERLARDMPLRMRLGAAARAQLLRRGFTWDDNARRITSLLEVLRNGGCAAVRPRS